jgi:NitT/TauT family transport system substrate-binding protein
MYAYHNSRQFIEPFFVFLQCIPMFALAPIMVLWFGWSYFAIVVPTALMLFLPLTMNIYQGLSQTPQGLLELFKLNQATKMQVFCKLQLPWSLPFLFAGFKISAAVAGIGAAAGEWAGGQAGLGILMQTSRRATDLQTTFAAILCLTLISLALYGLMSWIESCFSKHKPWKSLIPVGGLVLLFLISIIFQKDSRLFDSKKLLLDWIPNTNHVPLYAGLKKGIFAKKGINLEILQIQDPGDTIPYITSGQTDLAVFYMPDVIRINKKSKEVHLVASLIAEPLNSFIFRKSDDIKNPSDLSGKIIGYCVAGSCIELLKKMCNRSNVYPKDYKNVCFDLVSTLGLNKVDVIYGAFWNIEKEHLAHLGLDVAHFNVTDLGHPTYPELVLIAKEPKDWHGSFKQALQESIDFCCKEPDVAFDYYKSFHADKSMDTLTWEKKAWLKTLQVLPKSQEIAEEQLKQLDAWLY